ncbi:ATP-binding protein [Acetobacterium carbinolicum]|uniref:PAS domain-containing hybrid sensor histidine kinase/response regulator n=1 Tax=Acetobacterium carbinolicum TaxID=52690 RepID=UPI0039BF6132
MDEMRQQIINKDKAWLVSTLNSAGDAIITCNMDDRMDFANAEALNILGLSLAEILDKPFLEVFKLFRDGQDMPIQFWTNAKKGEMADSVGLPGRSYYLKSDGTKCYLSARLSPLLSDSGDYIGRVVVFRDISRIIEAEITIKNERNNLKTMFDLLPTSMLVVDEKLLITRANRAFFKTFNLDMKNVIGRQFGDALGCVFSFNGGCGYSKNCEFCHFRKIVTRVLEEKKIIRDRSIKVNFINHGIEDTRYLNLSVMPIISANYSEYIITLEDMTEQYYYEKGLKEAREASLSILDSLPVMIYRIDRDQRCDFINQTFKAFMNISRDFFLKNLKSHMKTDDHKRFINTLKRSLKEKCNFNIELELLAPNNTYRIFRGMGRPFYDKNQEYAGMIGLFLDIHDERFAEELFTKSQKKYFSLFKYMDSSISYFKALYDNDRNLIDAELVEMNLATEELFGVNRDEVIGHKLSEMGFLETKESLGLFKRFREVLTHGENIPLEEYYMIRLEKWVEGSIYSPESGYVAVLASDVDQKKKTEIKLKQAIERSEEANRAKSEFLANMSHEIRTPLNGIVGMIDLTALEPLSEEQKDNLRTAKGCVASLIAIINDILDFAKIEAGKLMINPMSFNLMSFVESTVKTHKKHALEKYLDLTVNYENIISNFVISDSMRLKQILNNLISNAIKFTNQGSVTITVSQEPLPGKTDQIVQKITIADTGIGIDEKDYPMLFQSFTQIDGSYTREYGGTGLGLVITKQLLEMMGGEVRFISQLGVGSTFSVILPMIITKKSGETDVETDGEDSFAGSRILLVEDDQVNQIVIAKMLESFGAVVDVAGNGVEGVKAASKNNYDIIFMDGQMPVMDGIKATKLIRGTETTTEPYFKPNELEESLNRETPIVALTAFALKGDEAIFKASGMDDYLSKPLDRHQMQQLLKKYLGHLKVTAPKRSVVNLGSYYEKEWNISKSNSTEHLTPGEKEKWEVTQKIESLERLLAQENLILMEVIAHQLKGIFEEMNIEVLKNLVFKIELEIRKERLEKVSGYLEQIREIWRMHVLT